MCVCVCVGRAEESSRNSPSGNDADKRRETASSQDLLVPEAGFYRCSLFTVPPPTDVEVICQNLNVHVRWRYVRAQSSFTVTLKGINGYEFSRCLAFNRWDYGLASWFRLRGFLVGPCSHDGPQMCEKGENFLKVLR